MSRSYKKTPIIKCAPRNNWGQKQANRRIRRIKGKFPFGCWYKKLYEQWDIHDQVSFCSLEEYLTLWQDTENWLKRHGYTDNWYGKDRKDACNEWRKRYLRK